MLVIGLTGGIASGKDTVAGILRELGARVIDADVISRELVEPGKPAWHAIVGAFGRDILDEKEEIDRRKLADIVFRDSEKRALLNAIMHPKVIEEEWRRIGRIEWDEPDALVVVNAALLIETGNYRDVDVVVVVAAEEEKMIRRMMERDGLTREEAVLRLKAQLPIGEKVKFADYVIDNNGSLEELREKVIKLYEKLRKIEKSGTRPAR